MKHKLSFIALLVFSIALSSCFGIEEKILIHKDGSGYFTYTIDCTQMVNEMVSMLKKLQKDMKTEGASAKNETPLDIRSETIKQMKADAPFVEKDKLNEIKGISACEDFTDTADGKIKMGVRFKFDNVTALNNALKNILSKQDGKKAKEVPPPFYTFKDGVLSRELTKAAAEGLVGSDKDDEMTKTMLKDFTYTVVVESDSIIKNTTAPGSLIKTTGKKTILDYQVMEKNKEIVKARMKGEVRVY